MEIRGEQSSGISMEQRDHGGYSDGDPPLTIPNREVKPISADDTALTRVGK